MDFEFHHDDQEMQRSLRTFMDRHVLPSHPAWFRQSGAGQVPLDVIEPLKARAREAGLWNLFLPGLRDDEPGTRLTNLQYAPLAEIM
ncbi:MAG: acyl-CoA dehydrogenase, partial [Aquabacterium sp.]